MFTRINKVATCQQQLLVQSFRVRNHLSIRQYKHAVVASKSDIQYEKKTPREHVLLRPGMYVGQVDWIRYNQWIYNETLNKMQKKEISYSPALLKIFDEILVNAADNFHRNTNLKTIKVNVEKNGEAHGLPRLKISVLNDGQSIPIEIHEKEKLFIPELIFGHLLTGSNFNDSVSRLTGGSHGYGAKLTNIFSNHFEVEIYDHENRRKYRQLWSENMNQCNAPVVDQYKIGNNVELPAKKSYIQISYEPDLRLFGLSPSMDKKVISQNIDDLLYLIQRRTFDVAGCLKDVDVYYNSKLLPVQSFDGYINLFTRDHGTEEG